MKGMAGRELAGRTILLLSGLAMAWRLLAHPESAEAAQGANIGLKGENVDIARDL